MKTIPIIIFGALLLSCGEQKKQREMKWTSVEVEESYNTSLAHDSVKAAASESKENVMPTMEPSPSSRSARSSSRSDNNDNMRGFDPASEDDMDDNGMSRYMENNDEEGWD